jgi:hypothetical protein
MMMMCDDPLNGFCRVLKLFGAVFCNIMRADFLTGEFGTLPLMPDTVTEPGRLSQCFQYILPGCHISLHSCSSCVGILTFHVSLLWIQ